MKASSLAFSDGKATQRQIAEQLGVSRQLVSFALQGKGRMSGEKRQQILHLARENNYHEFSNHEARQMISRHYGKRVETGMLAVVFNSKFEGQPIPSLPFFSPFFEGLENEAIKRSLDLVLCPLRSGKLPLLVREVRVDGVICLFTPECETARIQSLPLPLVSLPYEAPNTPCIGIENQKGISLATQHLIDLGHRRIGYIGISPTTDHIGAQRWQGYHCTLKMAGLDENPSAINTEFHRPTRQAGSDAANTLLNSASSALPFSALVCYNDEMAMGAVTALQQAGWNVPHQVSVTGFDDISRHSNFAPTLTSLAFPRQEMGRKAVQLLCEHNQLLRQERNASDFADYRHQFPVQLVERDSTAPPAQTG